MVKRRLLADFRSVAFMDGFLMIFMRRASFTGAARPPLEGNSAEERI